MATGSTFLYHDGVAFTRWRGDRGAGCFDPALRIGILDLFPPCVSHLRVAVICRVKIIVQVASLDSFVHLNQNQMIPFLVVAIHSSRDVLVEDVDPILDSRGG